MKKKTKTKLFYLKYVPRSESWEYKTIKKKPKRVPRNVSIVRSTTPRKALMKLSRRSYYGETGRRLK